MNNILAASLLIAIALVMVIVSRQIVYHRKSIDDMQKRNAFYEEQQKSALLGKGLIVHSTGSVGPTGSSSQAHVSLTMEITQGEGRPYRAKTRWLVDVTALSYVAQGQEIAVKIDKDDKSIIYPNASWAKYIGA